MSQHDLYHPPIEEKSASNAGGKRYKRVIDAHMHWYPQAFVDLMIKRGRPMAR